MSTLNIIFELLLQTSNNNHELKTTIFKLQPQTSTWNFNLKLWTPSSTSNLNFKLELQIIASLVNLKFTLSWFYAL